jgi:hypothetical protein
VNWQAEPYHETMARLLTEVAADDGEVQRQIRALQHGLARLRQQTRRWDKRDRRREEKHRRKG